MTPKFCTGCGTKLVADARFCVACGLSVTGVAAARPSSDGWLSRFAPLIVVVTLLIVGATVVTIGMNSPKTPPPAPRPDAPSAPGPAALPADHPPMQIPEQVKQTIRDMAKQAEAAPDDVAKWKQLAEVQYRASQIDPVYLPDAEVSYQRILKLEPENLDAIRALGNVAYDRQDPGKAVEFYQQFLKLKPDDLEVQTDLGTMHLATGQADEAMKVYESVLKTNPKFFQAQFNMAIAWRAKGDPAKALEALEKSRELAPDEQTRTQVDQVLARIKGQPAAPGGAPAGGPAPQAQPQSKDAVAAGGSFQADADAVFKQNPVLGPKVQRIEWSAATVAKVFVRDFPMDQMGPEMRGMFTERMKGRIRDKKAAYKVSESARFEIVDEASGRVMETITE